MKNLILILALIIAQIAMGQINEHTSKPDVEVISLSIEVDSFDDLAEFDLKELLSLYELSENDHPIELKIICNFEHETDGVTLSNTEFSVKGYSGKLKSFIDQTAKVKTAFNKLYNTKR
ncbi:MAG: hypothetical protein HKN00_12910 [Flavobacteriaceae bacterium]|nr:hypothetical protein [Bacteroidia bacterium]NNF76083.1 hypothetical protein [Flavobacteriaceae bacterium]